MTTQMEELHLAMTERLERQLHEILLPERPRDPERGVIVVVHASTGERRRTLLLHRVIEPEEGDVVWSEEEGLVFSARYKSRALDIAAPDDGAGLAFIHTHPTWPSFPGPPAPSDQDLESDARDLFHLGRSLSPNAPLLAGILRDNGRWSAREYKFQFPVTRAQVRDPDFGPDGGTCRAVDKVRIVGRRLRTVSCRHEIGHPSVADDAQDSSIRLWGEAGQRRLAELRVGLTGAGGVGGILAEHLARLGVGELVVVDFDLITRENLNRSQGATREDAERHAPKVHVAERLARMSATCPEFDVVAVRGSVVEAETIPYLLDCDIILNAADSPWARQVLDHIAFAHLIPVVDGGTLLVGDVESGNLVAGKSQVSTSIPHEQCLACAGSYTLDGVTEAQEAPELRGERGYVEGADDGPVREPSVISFNAIVAGLMQLRLQAIAVGTTPETSCGAQQYHPQQGVLHWKFGRACNDGCRPSSVIARGDSHRVPIGKDLDFARLREDEAKYQMDQSEDE